MGRPSRHRWMQVGGEGGSKKSGGWNRKKINGKENRSNKKKIKKISTRCDGGTRVHFPYEVS